jgi:hypothetical protein
MEKFEKDLRESKEDKPKKSTVSVRKAVTSGK